jgi:hypothetical protein
MIASTAHGLAGFRRLTVFEVAGWFVAWWFAAGWQ